MRSLLVPVAATAVFSVLIFSFQPVYAFKLPVENPKISVNWDNTIKYSTAWRLEDQDEALISDMNMDDGDRNFDEGIVSNRVDLYSEFDAVYREGMSKSFGIRFSAAAWYDTIYNSSNDNDSPLTANSTSVAHDEFTGATRNLHGRYAELMDAFIFAQTLVGSGGNLSARIGRFAQVWGETLFMGANGIAGTMAPVDGVKALSVPGTTFKEIIRPVGQVSVDYQVVPDLTFNFFYQFEWEETRLPAAGSFISNADFLFEGGERVLLGPGFGLNHGEDMEASDSGQFGMAMKFHFQDRPETYGLYAVRYHSKAPCVYGYPVAGIYKKIYPEKIWAFAGSASRTFGDVNLGAEVMYQTNVPLASNAPSFVFPGMKADNGDNPLYAVGKTFHANLSAIWMLPRTPLFNEALFMGEVGYNRRVSTTKNENELDPDTTRDAWGFMVLFTPTYRQVLVSGLDVSVPISLQYSPMAKSSANAVAFGHVNNGGTLGAGLKFTYRQVWIGSLQYSKFLGANTGAFSQSKADRDNISFSIQRTF